MNERKAENRIIIMWGLRKSLAARLYASYSYTCLANLSYWSKVRGSAIIKQMCFRLGVLELASPDQETLSCLVSFGFISADFAER